jgi:V/A-type H+/Na+-transporting ATPase subunit C
MRLAAPADFAYGNTRLHARRGDLLGTADYERLIGEDVDGLLRALETTPYAHDAEATRHQGLRRLHDTIRIHLGRTLEEMRSFYANRARGLVDQLLSRFDVHNVVTVLRAQAGAHRPAEDALGALIDIGWLSGPLARETLGQHELTGAVDLLTRRTPHPEQAGALRAAFREYERTTDLPALERAVLADHAIRAVGTLTASGPGARTLLRFARREIDERNLLVALRLRDAPAEHWPGHTLLAGGSIAPPDLEPALRTPEPSRVAAALGGRAGGSWQPALGRWAVSGDLAALERELERRRIIEAAGLFVDGDPLAIDVPIAFSAAKEMEARNLRLLGEASARDIHADTVRQELLLPKARA